MLTTLDPVDVDLPVPVDDDDVGGEVTLSYRLWRNLHVQGGFADLGNFSADSLFFGTATISSPAPLRNPLATSPR